MERRLPPHVIPSPEVIFQVVHDEAVLMDMASEQYFALNPPAVRMWQLLLENSDTTTAIDKILSEFDVDEITLREDMAAWIGELHQFGLVFVDTDVP